MAKREFEHGDYEIHLTFYPKVDVRTLRERANDWGGELYEFTNYTRSGKEIPDLVWAYQCKHYTRADVDGTLDEAARYFIKHRLPPIRQKIDVIPWFCEVPQQESLRDPHYWEAHVKAWDVSRGMAQEQGFHVSTRKERTYTVLTQRSTDPRASFELGVQLGLSYLMNAGARIGGWTTEYILLDTNRELDRDWMDSL